MLSFSPIEKPKIDIELYGTDINIAPIDKVHIMDEDSFEHFTLEWLYGCKKDKYSSIMRIGGAGDKGRDVIAYRKDGGVDYFQCKHYNSALAPSNYYLELGKLCYYTYTKDIPLPKSYYIVASNDIGPTLQDLLDNSAQLLSSLLDNWDTYCRFKITKSKEINLDADLLGYIRLLLTILSQLTVLILASQNPICMETTAIGLVNTLQSASLLLNQLRILY